MSNRFKGLALAVLVMAWSGWQILLAFGLAIPGISGPWGSAIHLIFSSLVIAAFTLHSQEIRAQSHRFSTWVAVGGIAIATLAVIVGEPVDATILTAATGLTGLLILVVNSLGWPIAIAGTAIFLAGLGFHGSFGMGAQTDLAVIVQQAWSEKGVFGDGLTVSASYLFVFLGLGLMLRKGAIFEALSRFFSNVRKPRASGGRNQSLLMVIANGMLTGATSAALSARTGITQASPLPEESSRLSQAEQGSLLAVAASIGQLSPPIMTAAGFLIARSLDIAFLDVLVAVLIPSFLAGVALMYFSRAAVWRQQTVDTRSEVTQLLKGAVLALLVTSGFSLVAITVLSLDLEPNVSLHSALALATLLLSAQWAFMVWASRTHRDEESFIVRVSHSYWGVFGMFLLMLIAFRENPEYAAVIGFVYGLLLTGFRKALKPACSDQTSSFDLVAGLRSVLDDLTQTCKATAIVAVALAFVGIVVAPVTLMGLGPVLTDLFISISGGSLLSGLLIAAVVAMLAGLAFSTTATYLLVATLMVPIVSSIGAETGVLPSLISLHIFVLFFAVLSDLTPPDDIAIEGIARSWGIGKARLRRAAFAIAMPVAVLPFAFVGRNAIFLSEGVQWQELIAAIVPITFGLLLIVHVALWHFIERLNIWRALLLTCIAFIFMLPPPVLQDISEKRVAFNTELPEKLAQKFESSQSVVLEFVDPFEITAPHLRVDMQVLEGGSVADSLLQSGISFIVGNRDDVFIRDIKRTGYYSPSKLVEGMRLASMSSTMPRFDYRAFYLVAGIFLFLVVAISWRSIRRDSDATI